MQQLTPQGQNLVNELSSRYHLSSDTIIYMIGAVNNGGGTMAQFNSFELGGSGQWMKGGMTMVGDMFNNNLKNTVDNLCSDISHALATMTIFPVAPVGTPKSNQWWPTHLNLGLPLSSGGQNSTRYALFPHRLAVDNNGEITVYDTLDNTISGVSQQQGGESSLTFTSQYGTILVSTLPIIYSSNTPSSAPQNSNIPSPQNFIDEANNPQTQPSTQIHQNESPDTIIALIEKLSSLHQAGALSDNEFNTKKTELLNRL